jgi:hypothetical protein
MGRDSHHHLPNMWSVTAASDLFAERSTDLSPEALTEEFGTDSSY